MCGITGFISFNNLNEFLRPALDCLSHRGPDAEGMYINDDEKLFIGLGHRRLSIIDLSEGANQPMHSNSGAEIIVFNGEIYNFEELRGKLPNSSFNTRSDTEVLLNLYTTYGLEMLGWLEGMFAFAIYDKAKGQVLLARDALGIKPLYYHASEDTIVFASEIKSIFAYGIKRELDQDALKQFMLSGFVYEPLTGYKNVRKVGYGSYSMISVHKEKLKIETGRHWAPQTKDCNGKASQIEIEKLIDHSVKSHLVSDVPVGLFFSGGIDSSVILTQTLQNITPITINYDQEALIQAGTTNDEFYANKIAEHLEVPLTHAEFPNESSEDFLNNVETLSGKAEELMLDYTFIASEKLSEISKNAGYTVMLSGMGGDECFGGYDRYKLVAYESRYKILYNFIPFSIFKKVKSFSKKAERLRNYFANKDFASKYNSLVGYFSLKEVGQLTRDSMGTDSVAKGLNSLLLGYEHFSPLKKAMLMDLSGFLAHNFSVADKSSMLHQIEMRVPLATSKLFDYVWSLDDSEIMSVNEAKILLKRYLEKYLPSKLIYRKKTGFNPPLDKKIDQLGYKKFIDLINRNKLGDLLDMSIIETMAGEHYNKKSKNNTYKLYQLLYLSFWYKNITS